VARDYPVCLRLQGRRCVVVGAGRVAEGRARGLWEAGGEVCVVGVEVAAGLEDLAAEGSITLKRRGYRPGDLTGAFLVVIATDDPVVNAAVRAEAGAAGALVNAAWDDREADFTVPAMVRRGDLTIAVATAGKAPALAAHLKRQLESQFGPEFGPMVELLGEVRTASRGDGLPAGQRRQHLRRVLGPRLFGLMRRGRTDEARQLLTGCPEGDQGGGFVSIVGAGPGDPSLLTVAARDRLAMADAVFYDRLLDPTLLDLAPWDAERVYIGKAYGHHELAQDEMNEVLISYARQGRRVVRLKGGDPFVFGRGGEEAAALARAGIAFEVVPGVTSALAAAAYAGIPVTDRERSHSVAVVTGNRAPDDPANEIDWAALGRSVDTIVILMGMRWLEQIARALVRSGRSAGTPAAAVEWGTWARQRTLVAPLSQLAAAVRSAGLGSPTVIVIGEVVRLRETLSWFEEVQR
jgi:uroporphyrin-III C-methyltransferase/precorrin-2 dehydrogenase/sirohydrochlorin ferrochelatase